VNRDGVPDVLVGATSRDHGCKSDTGAVYVLYGRAPGVVHLRGLDRRSGFRRWSAGRYERLGAPLRGLADVTGDGLPELLAGAARAPGDGRRLPHAYLRTGVRPGRAPGEAARGTCLRVRVPHQRLDRIAARGSLRVVVTAAERGHVDLFAQSRGGLVIGIGRAVFKRAGTRSIAVRLRLGARRRFRHRSRVRIDLEVTQYSRRSDDVRTVERRLLLR
jgi:hypothetical protein